MDFIFTAACVKATPGEGVHSLSSNVAVKRHLCSRSGMERFVTFADRHEKVLKILLAR